MSTAAGSLEAALDHLQALQIPRRAYHKPEKYTHFAYRARAIGQVLVEHVSDWDAGLSCCLRLHPQLWGLFSTTCRLKCRVQIVMKKVALDERGNKKQNEKMTDSLGCDVPVECETSVPSSKSSFL